jgi:hypothetical protein
MGTSSWRILNRHQEHTIVTGTNFVPGRPEDQSSYRSRAAGMFSIIIFIALIVEYYEIQQGSVEVACDEIEALRAVSREFRTPKSGSNSFDIVAPTRKHLSQSPLIWTFRNLKGHQDKLREEFDIWERLNDDCDNDAGVFREWCESQHIPNHSISFPLESWTIWKGADKVASNQLHSRTSGKTNMEGLRMA